MPKSSKTLRTKTTLHIEDAIVYQAIANVLSENNYDKLDQYSQFVFGSVLNQDVKKGAAILKEENPNFFSSSFGRVCIKNTQIQLFKRSLRWSKGTLKEMKSRQERICWPNEHTQPFK